MLVLSMFPTLFFFLLLNYPLQLYLCSSAAAWIFCVLAPFGVVHSIIMIDLYFNDH